MKLSLTASLLIGLCIAAVAEAKPNLIVIIADDLGYHDVSYNGDVIQTPHIDSIAQRGAKFTQFYVQPVCSPTRAAFLTGRYPFRLGLQCGVVRPWATYGLDLKERTLAEALGEAGYATAIAGKWHLGHLSPDYFPTRRGFDFQYGHYNGAIDYFKLERDGGHDWHLNDKPHYEQGYSTELIGRHAAQFVRDQAGDKPFFLYVPFNAPHTPLQAPNRYIAKYENIPQKPRRIYAAMVACLDDAVGEILSAVRDKGIEKETLIFFCSDNGGIPRLGSNGPLRAGKSTLYEGGTRVVACARWPGQIQPGAEISGLMHIVDLYPTLIQLAGGSLKQERPLDGLDLGPTILDGKPSPRKEVVLNITPFHAGLRVGNWKLVRNGQISSNHTQPVPGETYELFNLADDLGEQKNLAEKHPDQLAKLKQKLADYQQQAAKPHIAPNRPPRQDYAPQIWGHGPVKR